MGSSNYKSCFPAYWIIRGGLTNDSRRRKVDGSAHSSVPCFLPFENSRCCWKNQNTFREIVSPRSSSPCYAFLCVHDLRPTLIALLRYISITFPADAVWSLHLFPLSPAILDCGKSHFLLPLKSNSSTALGRARLSIATFDYFQTWNAFHTGYTGGYVCCCTLSLLMIDQAYNFLILPEAKG